MEETLRPGIAETLGLKLTPLQRKASLSNLSPLRNENLSEKQQLKRMKILREYLLENALNTSISKEAMLDIFEGNMENLKKALNTVYHQDGRYETLFFEYFSTLMSDSDAKKYINNLELLISLGVDVNKCTNKTGVCVTGDFESDNALLFAMARGDLDLVHYIASKGGKTYGNMSGAIGHHGKNVQDRIKDAYMRGAAGLEGGTRKKRRANRRKTCSRR
jgi:hypothetical protein